MGKQYNFFIGPKQDLDFIKYLFENEYEIIVPQFYEHNGEMKYDFRLSNLIIYKEYNDFIAVHEHYHKLWVYKESWGCLEKQENGFFDELKSPVIEYMRCFIYKEENYVSRGRLYISTQHKDEINFYTVICKEYQKFVRLIKKDITYKCYQFENGRELSWPVSQEMINLINKDYRIEN